MQFSTLLPTLFVASCLADATTYKRDVDLLKRLAPPPKLSRRTPTIPALVRRRAQSGCSNGFEQCPGLKYCCQAGLTCFSDGTCGSMDELMCMTGESVCGSGTKAGCCPIKSSCVNNEQCVVNSGGIERRWGGVGWPAVVVGVLAAGLV